MPSLLGPRLTNGREKPPSNRNAERLSPQTKWHCLSVSIVGLASWGQAFSLRAGFLSGSGGSAASYRHEKSSRPAKISAFSSTGFSLCLVGQPLGCPRDAPARHSAWPALSAGGTLSR